MEFSIFLIEFASLTTQNGSFNTVYYFKETVIFALNVFISWQHV